MSFVDPRWLWLLLGLPVLILLETHAHRRTVRALEQPGELAVVGFGVSEV